VQCGGVLSVRLTISRSWLQIPAYPVHVMTLGKLFTLTLVSVGKLCSLALFGVCQRAIIIDY